MERQGQPKRGKGKSLMDYLGFGYWCYQKGLKEELILPVVTLFKIGNTGGRGASLEG